MYKVVVDARVITFELLAGSCVKDVVKSLLVNSLGFSMFEYTQFMYRLLHRKVGSLSTIKTSVISTLYTQFTGLITIETLYINKEQEIA